MHRSAVDTRHGEIAVSLPTAKTPFDLLERQRVDMDIKGTMSSLCSALDCLAALIVGVMGLEQDLRKADIVPALNACRKVSASPEDPRFKFVSCILRELQDAGPTGWHKYLVDFRNMILHRGRRMSFGTLIPSPQTDIRRGGQTPKIHTRVVHYLASWPNLSEVEMWSQGHIYPLEETGQTTIKGLVESVLRFVNGVSGALVECWIERSKNPSLIVQPKNQWKYQRPILGEGFQGYLPGSEKHEANSIIGNPSLIVRMKMAHVDGARISFWRNVE